jgi:hypothetical protein
MSMVAFRELTAGPMLRAEAERIHNAWNDALAAHDVDAITALYAEEATIESPLVRYLLGVDEGICCGRDAIRAFIPLVFLHQPSERRTYRNPVFFDGKTMMWEYPRETPEGDQMDFTEVMELDAGMIQRHRVYWGWYGVRTLTTGSHRR